MPRLPRPAIPAEIKLRVVLRQLGEFWVDEFVAQVKQRRAVTSTVRDMLAQLAVQLGCEVGALRLDHNPALALRKIVRNRAGVIVRYIPDANDPEHLVYREAHAHHIKTNVRGDGAQHPDRVLIKRERRRARRASEKHTNKVRGKKRKQPKRRWGAGRKMQSRGWRSYTSTKATYLK